MCSRPGRSCCGSSGAPSTGQDAWGVAYTLYRTKRQDTLGQKQALSRSPRWDSRLQNPHAAMARASSRPLCALLQAGSPQRCSMVCYTEVLEVMSIVLAAAHAY